MDPTKIVEALRATLVADQQRQAEEYLKQVNKIIGFTPQLLQIVMSENLEMPVRQAGAIFLKNTVVNHWDEDEKNFMIHENDKQIIKENLIQAIIAAANPVRVQLSVCVTTIVKSDYPGRWTGFVEKILAYLTSDQPNTWLGSLLCLYQLVKFYEYKKSEERKSLNEAMFHFLPVIQNMLAGLFADQSELSVTIQKQILKIFFAFTQVWLPMDILTKEIFAIWMRMVCQLADRPVPLECNQVDEDDRPDLIWWKCRKWALHILTRVFERYGSPGSVSKEYNKFAEWYIKTFSEATLEVMLKILDKHRSKEYVSPRVLQLTLNYLTHAVAHAASWKVIRPHIQIIIQDIVFPLMCHSEEDEEMWQNDPVEYIRIKYDVYEEFFHPATAAQSLLHDVVSKRKDVLEKTMAFVMSVLVPPNTDPRQKSGALQMVGSLAEILLNKKVYKDQAEIMLIQYVVPELGSQLGYMRSRACWVLHSYSEVKFKDPSNLQVILESLVNILSNDGELPVKIEAAIGLQMMLAEQESAKEIIQPRVQKIIVELLNLIRETENDDLTSVLQKIVCVYSEEITPLAVEITSHLAQTFAKVIDSVESDSSEDKSITLMGILNTLETICSVMEEEKEVLKHIEGVVMNVIVYIIQHDVSEFFEEMFTLIYSLTSSQITPNMWGVLSLLYDAFQRDNIECFSEVMPCLHNYVTVDPGAFLADPKWLEIIFNMCKMVLNSESGEDNEVHAAKLLEVILLQFKGLIDNVVPLIVQLIIHRLFREIKTTELRTMCLQVVIAALYYNPIMLLNLLNCTAVPNSNASITGHFLKQWLNDSDCFLGLHDRKMFVLGLCTILNLPNGTRPPELNEIAKDVLPSLILVFKGLKRAYETRLKEEEEEETENGGEVEDNEVEDDEDVIDNEGDEYMRHLEKTAKADGDEDNSDDDDEYEDDDCEETALEGYETLLDKDDCPVEEYQIFKAVMESLQHSDITLYQFLTSCLTEEQKSEIDEIFRLAEQKRAAAESRRIEQAGGYNFTNIQIPTSFCFGGAQ